MSAEPEGGLRAWDVETGEALGHTEQGQVYAFDAQRGRALVRVDAEWFEVWLERPGV